MVQRTLDGVYKLRISTRVTTLLVFILGCLLSLFVVGLVSVGVLVIDDSLKFQLSLLMLFVDLLKVLLARSQLTLV